MTDDCSELQCGTAIIGVLRGINLSWLQMFSEFADNSLGANASRIEFRRRKGFVQIVDNGEGCDDLRIMQSLARSSKGVDNKASMYGIGGVMSQIYASGGSATTVESITSDVMSKMIVDWNDCLAKDRLAPMLHKVSKTPPGAPTGTTISFNTTRKYQDSSKLIRDLSCRYAPCLKRGKTMLFEVDGQSNNILPYVPPPLTNKVKFNFTLDGHRITGFCGVVKNGKPNPYAGLSISWGYRFLGQFHEPSDGKATNRIYGEVHLPESWTNINVTKDAFVEDPETLWLTLADHCRKVIEAAEQEAYEIELAGSSEAAEEIIGSAIRRRGIKGARPGCTGKHGTMIPTGKGGKHRHFTTSQPGSKVFVEEPLPARMPDKVRIVFDPTIEEVQKISMSGIRSKTCILTMNPSYPLIDDLKNHPGPLAAYCLNELARAIADGPDELTRSFPAFRGQDYIEIHKQLLGRASVPELAGS